MDNGRKSALLYEIAFNFKASATLKHGYDISYKKLETDYSLCDSRFQTSFGGLPASNIGWDNLQEDLEKIYLQVVEWHEIDLGDRESGLKFDRSDYHKQLKVYYYEKTLESIYFFIKEYSLDFPSPTIGDISLIESVKQGREKIWNSYDIQNWWASKVKSLHRVYPLCKFRGFDPITFTRLPDDGLHRHHFRAIAFRKSSSHVSSFILTSDSIHRGVYEQLFRSLGERRAEAYVSALVSTWEELDSLRDINGKTKRVTEDDLINALKNNFGLYWRDPYNKMCSQGKNSLINNLNNYYDEGIFIENNGYQQWLKASYHSVYIDDFNNVRKIQFSHVLVSQKDIDFLNLVYKGFARFKLI